MSGIPGNTPYEVLGVARDASADQIRRAYRKLVTIWHPDKPTGDINSFRKIQNAYDVLSDSERRRRYDQTGREDASRITPKKVAAFFRDSMRSVIHAQRQDGSTDDPTMDNILQKMIVSNRASRQQVQQARHDTYRKLERATRILERMKAKGEEDIIGDAIREEIENLKAEMRTHEDALELSEEVEKVMKQYQYEVGTRPEGHYSPAPTARAKRTPGILGFDPGYDPTR